MRYCCLISLLFATSFSLLAQKKDLIKRYGYKLVSDSGIFVKYATKLINDTTDISKPQFLVYPTVAYSPETSWEFGLSSLYVYYAKRDTTNRLSELNGFAFYTLQSQYGCWVEHALYTHRNKWFFLGKGRFQSFPLLYFGVGPRTASVHLAQVDAIQVQIKERFFRKILPHFYGGVDLDFQQLSSVQFKSHNEAAWAYPLGSEGSRNLGFGLGLIYDTRHNILNVRKGVSSELAFLNYSKSLGSDYSFMTLLTDSRVYKPLSGDNVLAGQLMGQFNFGNTPFNQMALLGGENMMRGYYMGRYRDNNLIAAQLEMRFLPLPLSFSKRFGAAVFGSTGTVFNTFSAIQPSSLVWASGAGLRFLLFPQKDVFTRLDFAFTKEGSGIYIFIGEAF